MRRRRSSPRSPASTSRSPTAVLARPHQPRRRPGPRPGAARRARGHRPDLRRERRRREPGPDRRRPRRRCSSRRSPRTPTRARSDRIRSHAMSKDTTPEVAAPDEGTATSAYQFASSYGFSAAGPGLSRPRLSGPRPRRETRWWPIVGGLIVPAVLLLAWWAITEFGDVPAYRLPSPADVAKAAVDLGRDRPAVPRRRHLDAAGAASASRSVRSIGLVLGALVGLSRTASVLLSPTIGALRAVPSLAWVPLLVLYVGIGEPPKLILIAIGAAFPVFTTLVDRAPPRRPAPRRGGSGLRTASAGPAHDGAAARGAARAGQRAAARARAVVALPGGRRAALERRWGSGSCSSTRRTTGASTGSSWRSSCWRSSARRRTRSSGCSSGG